MKTLLHFIVFLLLSAPAFGQNELYRPSNNLGPSIYKRWDDGFLISQRNADQSLDTFNFTEFVKGNDSTRFFVDQHGDTITHEDFQGKVVLIDFWFLKCMPCIADLPRLEILQAQFDTSEFEVITFCNDSLERLQETIMKNHAFNFRIIANTYLVNNKTYPNKILVDGEGQVLDIKVGGNASAGNLKQLVEIFTPQIEAAITAASLR